MKANSAPACLLCGGTLERRMITHAVVLGNRVVVFQDVPAAVCRQCGEPFFAGDVVDQMNQFAWALPETTGHELSVHFHTLAGAVAAT